MTVVTRAVMLLCLVGGPGCPASVDEVLPPQDELFFPTGIAVADAQGVLFVANANSELRYNAGTILVVDLGTVDEVVAAWTTKGEIPEDCEQDSDHRETLVCEERVFIRPAAGVQTGNFATAMAIQQLDSGALRLVVPMRGDPSITYVEWDGSQLSCAKDGGAPCDDDHRLSYLHGETEAGSIPAEPFGVYADSMGQVALVTHMSNGSVSLVDSPRSGAAQISDSIGGVFAADSTTGYIGAPGVSGRAGPNGTIFYVASSTEDRIQTFTVVHPVNNAPPLLVPGTWFFLDAVGGNIGGSSDSRDLEFSADGNRLYLVNRDPPTLQVLDTSLGDTGFPRNVVIGATDICRTASTLAITGDTGFERAYVSCFQDGQVYVVDVRDGVTVADVLLVGRGPYDVAPAPSRNKVFVTNFLEDSIAVIDTSPTSATHDRVVLRIGHARPQ